MLFVGFARIFKGLYSLSRRTSYRKISWSLVARRFRFRLFQSFWNLTGTSATGLPRYNHYNTQSRGFENSRDLTVRPFTASPVVLQSYNRLPQYQRITLQWLHNGLDGVSNHQPHDSLLNRLFRRRWKKTSKLRVAGLCVGNSQGTGEFPAQRAINAEKGSIWWSHYEPRTMGVIEYTVYQRGRVSLGTLAKMAETKTPLR